MTDDTLDRAMRRAERAEAEANTALRRYHDLVDTWGREIDLADRLAEAMRWRKRHGAQQSVPGLGLSPEEAAALAAYDEARRETLA